MPIRNPFKRAPGSLDVDEAARQGADGDLKDTNGAKPIEIPEPPEYKLCGMSSNYAAVLVARDAWAVSLTSTRDQR